MREFYFDCTGRSREELERALAECLKIPEILEDTLASITDPTLVVFFHFNAAESSCKGLKTLLKKAEKKNADFHPVFDTPFEEGSLWRLPCELTEIRRRYHVEHSLEHLEAQVVQFFRANRKIPQTSALLVSAGEDYMIENDSDAAWVFFRSAEKCPELYNDITLYMRLAQIHLEKGQQDKGVAYLIKLCTETVDNYEESLGFHELTEVWEKYKHLVEGQVPPSVSIHDGPQPLSPDECSQSIDEIFALPEDDMLLALSRHLDELSGSGEELNYLNKWERCVYYLDELSMEVNSGGFDSYLYQHGEHYHKARKALENLDAPGMTALLDAVAAKFPRGKVPKSQDAIQNAMEKLEEKGIDFEVEDEAYYTGIECGFLTALTNYVLENRKHFR